MNVLTAAANELSDLHDGFDTFLGHFAMDIESREKPNDAPEFASARSSYSDFADFVLPPDIPDGPSFYDLAGHIDQVTQQLNGQSHDALSMEVSKHSIETVLMSSGSDVINTVILEDSLPTTELMNNGSLDHPPVESQAPCKPPNNLSPTTVVAETFTCFNYAHELGESLSKNQNFPPNAAHEAKSVDSPTVSNENVEVSLNYPVSMNAAPSAECEDSLSDDDFGDFECSASVATTFNYTDCNKTEDPAPMNTASVVLERLLSHLGPALTRAFETLTNDTDQLSCADEDHLRHFTRHPFSSDRNFQSGIRSQLVSAARPRNRRYRWDNSAIYEAYLESVHVDKLSSTPVFAPRLELLQPVRLTDSNSSVSSAGHIEGTLTAAALAQANSPKSCNGTTSAPILSESLDLDFLENLCGPIRSSEDNPKPVTLSALELELLTQVPEASVPAGSDTSLFAPTLSDTSSKPPLTNLRDNVRAALARLPKLTYMRSRHLNIPISDVRHNS